MWTCVWGEAQGRDLTGMSDVVQCELVVVVGPAPEVGNVGQCEHVHIYVGVEG